MGWTLKRLESNVGEGSQHRDPIQDTLAERCPVRGNEVCCAERVQAPSRGRSLSGREELERGRVWSGYVGSYVVSTGNGSAVETPKRDKGLVSADGIMIADCTSEELAGSVTISNWSKRGCLLINEFTQIHSRYVVKPMLSSIIYPRIISDKDCSLRDIPAALQVTASGKRHVSMIPGCSARSTCLSSINVSARTCIR